MLYTNSIVATVATKPHSLKLTQQLIATCPETMKDATNYFIPIVKDPINDITGRCVTNNGLDTAYCGTYHQTTPPKINTNTLINNNNQSIHYPHVQMETNSMEIQYNNLIEIDDYQQQNQMQARLHVQPPNRKRNNCDCDADNGAKRCRREASDPPFLHPDTSLTQLPLQTSAKYQMHQRQPTHNMPDMPRCMMGHYI